MDLFALEELSFYLAFGSYVLATIMYISYLFTSKGQIGRIATVLAVVGLGVHTLSLVARTINGGRLPLNGLYDYATAFVWGTILCYLIFEKWLNFKYRGMGAFVLPIAIVIMGFATTFSNDIGNLMPALQSNWMTLHVATYIFAYGALAVSCGLSILYILKNRHIKKNPDNPHSIFHKHFPELKKIDEINYRAVAIGFLFLTLGLLSGAIWAEQAWGRYWGWDPKETWSLITWIVYALFLHTRFTRGWRGNKTAFLAIIGFGCILFTWLGVNMFISSIHSYA
ncbi:c-type cytochrome biogenesis protein CcsB [Natranaerofaba carboxydovora]|uniref:c-type cytochrome biogenesis protein CcsB n=1 Tax=Natranaerofaba carboxydovora TaxID=2742683 RepID=UPI001F146EA2|nr:c-type cytochrome biogenesis protein CcsB [Natranaerofaba carboxydovora]UMZ73201.1 Cytochrome c biogenesis protein CcsA [Natranaerofaba carboxydovora]